MRAAWARKTPQERLRWTLACQKNKPKHYKRR
jgi:hypothetical protein